MTRRWTGSTVRAPHSLRNSTQLEADSGPRSRSSVSLRIGVDWSLSCYTYPDRTPILALDAGETHLTVSTLGENATKDAVEFAWALVSAANDFLVETERLHFEAQETDTAGSDAA